MIKVLAPKGSKVLELLQTHPGVDVEAWEGKDLLFEGRTLSQGREDVLSGLVELADNNPMVCTAAFSVPSPLATLALIALGPLLRGSLVAGPIALHSASRLEADDLLFHLEQEGLQHEVTLALGAEDLFPSAALVAYVPIPELDDYDLVDGLFDEVFGRSFYVRPSGAGWTAECAAGSPQALYDLRLTPGDGESLLTVRVAGDMDGKLGACQLIHAFNVMEGFEEHLGIPDALLRL